MNTLFTLLFGLSMLAIPVLLVVMGIKFLKKQPVKKMKKGLLAAVVVWIGSLAGAGCTTSEPVLPQTLEIVVLQQQEVYDINSQIEVEILVTPENADASSIEYIVAKGNAEFTENTIYVGDVAGQVEVYVSCGEVTSNTVTISVVDVEAEKAAKEAEEKAAAEKAAKEAEEKAAAEKAAKEAEEKAAAEKAAKEAEEKAAAEKAAKEAEAQAAAEKAAKEAEAQAAAEKAAKEAEAQAAAEKAVKEAEAQAAVPTITQPQQTTQQNGGSNGGSGVIVPEHAETGENLVWVPTNGGKKYHTKSTCSKMIDPIQVTIETATANGYGPCGRCYK